MYGCESWTLTTKYRQNTSVCDENSEVIRRRLAKKGFAVKISAQQFKGFRYVTRTGKRRITKIAIREE